MQQKTLFNSNLALFVAILLVVGLYLDAKFLFWGQIGVSLFLWGVLLFIYQQAPKTERFMLMACLVLATLGEIFCSLVWGLYDYRFYNIPHYVPPGHVLLFLIGSVLALKLPHWISYLVPLLVLPYIVMGFWLGFDEFGLVLFLMFAACWFNGTPIERRLLSTMFLLSLTLEIYGTGLGNWTWRPEVQYWGLSNTNPPLASGAFYCVLDFLILLVLRTKGYSQQLNTKTAPPIAQNLILNS